MSTKIEWATKTWNPTTGCEKVSTGCENCYAINMSNRLQGMPASKDKYSGCVHKTKGGSLNWSGKVTEHMSELDTPKRWKKPQRIFVGSMSDIFHDHVSDTFLQYIFDTMASCPQHTFMVLTKRPERLAVFWEWYADDELLSPRHIGTHHIPNVWVGTSVENPEQAAKRLHHLLQVPATLRFVSCEPLLEELDISDYMHDSHCNEVRDEIGCICSDPREFTVDWVIAGGESGHKARPMHPDWVRSLRDQCNNANVPFFFKQWGEWSPQGTIKNYAYLNPEKEKVMGIDVVVRKGKKVSGRQLDGKEHNEFPNAKTL